MEKYRIKYFNLLIDKFNIVTCMKVTVETGKNSEEFYVKKAPKRQLLIERKWVKYLFLTVNQTICQK